MDSPLKQRLIGAAVLAALAIIFLPMLLKGPDVKEPDAAQVPLTMPGAPDQAFETRELPLNGPDTHTPPGGVLGMDTSPVPKPDATALAPVPETAASVAPTDLATYPTVTPVHGPATTPPSATPPGAALLPVTPPPTSKPTPQPTAPVAAIALAPDAAAPAVKPSAIAAGNYAVNVGSFSNISNANALLSRLKAAGLPASSEKVKLNGVDALRLRVGPYADRTAAEAARLRTESVAGSGGKVIALDATAAPAAPVKSSVADKPAAAPAVTPGKPLPTSSNAPVVVSKPATTVTSGFAVQLAAPAEESAALALRDRARAAGFAAFVQRVDTDNGPRFRVRAGPVADHNAAETLRDALSQKLGISGNIVAHP